MTKPHESTHATDPAGTATRLQTSADLLPAVQPLPASERYQPVRLHARGGLGEVHVAEDAELHRPVALKRIRPEQADDPDSRRRFLREAEITARLQHPAIVPVYGLAADQHGRPAYAMRFVEGESLESAVRRFHESKDFGSLEFRQLLGHFVAVCQAVAYAHSRGVVHRDLKPANVMLGPFGETYVVDWGVARTLEGPADAAVGPLSGDGDGDRTEIGSVVGTPSYMSPEQAAGRWDLLGPAADVYSLGAVLYCLLTGRPPVSLDSWPDMQERIERGDFPPPRQLDPAVPRPLDAISRKALAVDASARYQSALDLAADVERWLADEPVSADREPWRDRARRWVKRHRSLTAGLAAAVLVGLIGTGVGLIVFVGLNRQLDTALHSAEDQRDRALAARNRTRQSLDDMLSEKSLAWLETQSELSPRQRAFLEQVLGYYEQFAAEPGEDRLARKRLADAMFRVASLQGRLGRYDAVEATTLRAIELIEQLIAEDPTDAGLREDLGRVRFNRSWLLAKRGLPTEAEAEYRATLAIREKLAAEFPDKPSYRREVAATYNNMGVLLDELGRPDEAEALFRKSLAVREQLAAAFPDVRTYRQDVARAAMNVAVKLTEHGRRQEAEAAYRAALPVQEKLAADFPAVAEYRQDVARTQINFGYLLVDLDRQAEAEVMYRSALAAREKLAADFPLVPLYRQELGRSYHNLGELLIDGNDHGWVARPAEAEAALQAAIGVREKLVAEFPAVVEYRQELADSSASLGDCLAGRGKRAEAEAAYRRTLELREKLAAESPAVPGYRVDVCRSCTSFGNLFADHGDPAAGLPWFDRAVDGLSKVLKQHSNESTRYALGRAHAGRARALTRLHRPADADWERAIVLAEPADRPSVVLSRATELAKAGASDRAAEVLAGLAADPAVSPNVLYNAACVCATGNHGDQAVLLLRQAIGRRFRDGSRLLNDQDLASLRGRADFAELLWDVADMPPN
jgi:serine/threonine-protein kinase